MWKRRGYDTTRCNCRYRGAILRIRWRLLRPIDQAGFYYPTCARHVEITRRYSQVGLRVANESPMLAFIYWPAAFYRGAKISRHTSRVIVPMANTVCAVLQHLYNRHDPSSTARVCRVMCYEWLTVVLAFGLISQTDKEEADGTMSSIICDRFRLWGSHTVSHKDCTILFLQ